MLQRLPTYLDGATLDRRQAETSYLPCWASPFAVLQHLHFLAFVWPLILACIIPYVIKDARYMKRHEQVTHWRDPWKAITDTENLHL
jgi:hypothetical protein